MVKIMGVGKSPPVRPPGCVIRIFFADIWSRMLLKVGDRLKIKCQSLSKT